MPSFASRGALAVESAPRENDKLIKTINFSKYQPPAFNIEYLNTIASESYSDTEDRIQFALSTIKPDEKLNLSALARGWELPYQ
jgi:hypothetical protein